MVLLAVQGWRLAGRLNIYERLFDRGYSVAQRLYQFQPAFEARLRPALLRAGITNLPASVALVFLKDKKRLELFADRAGAMVFVKSYDVTAASGTSGPKLKEGDSQVPEGIYAVESLNPNSRFHLSLRLNYPNEFDRARGLEDGRTSLGGDIMIHGNRVSIGCIAIGDDAIEELFVLAALTDVSKWKVISSPVDFREGLKPDIGPRPNWLPALYEKISVELKSLKRI